MSQYLLDTNVCIHFLKAEYNLETKIREVGISNCFISEITLAELKYGVSKSLPEKKEQNKLTLENFKRKIGVIPLSTCLDIFADEKARLKKEGKVISDFDLLIGATAVANNMILVTRNIKHFERINHIQIENWIDNP